MCRLQADGAQHQPVLCGLWRAPTLVLRFVHALSIGDVCVTQKVLACRLFPYYINTIDKRTGRRNMDYLEILFTNDESVIAANKAEAARIAAVEAASKAEFAARKAAEAAARCPRCMGEGRLPQFAHRKGGECFTCGGSGFFTRYAA